MLSASKHTQHPSSTVKERMRGTDLPNFEFAMTTHRVTYTDSSSTSPRHVCTQTVRQFDYSREVTRGSASVRCTQASLQRLSQSFVLGLVPPEIAFLLPSFKFVKLLFHNLDSQRTTPRRGAVLLPTPLLPDFAKFSPTTPAHPLPAQLLPPTCPPHASPTPHHLSLPLPFFLLSLCINLSGSLRRRRLAPKVPPPAPAALSPTNALVLLESSKPSTDNCP